MNDKWWVRCVEVEGFGVEGMEEYIVVGDQRKRENVMGDRTHMSDEDQHKNCCQVPRVFGQDFDEL